MYLKFITMLFKIVIVIFILYFFIRFLFGVSVFRFLFGGKPTSNQNQQKTQNRSSSKFNKTKKIISRDEGEYIDFEEIKDKDQNSKS